MRCDTCGHTIHEGCNYNQGRCPHRKPMIEISEETSASIRSVLQVIFVGAIVGLLILGLVNFI